jgi:hypothetical protein
VLLAGSLLFVRSLRNLLTVDAGFQSEGIVLVNLNYTRSNYAKERRPAVIREIQDRLSATPGVLSAAQVGMTPVSGSGWNKRHWSRRLARGGQRQRIVVEPRRAWLLQDHGHRAHRRA